MDYKEKLITEVSEKIISSGIESNNSKKLISIITEALENYEINQRSTEIMIIGNESEQYLKLYYGTLLTEGRSKKTADLYVRTVRRFGNEIGKPLKEITSFDVRLWLAKLQQTVSLRTCENYRLYLSGFYSWMVNEEIIEKNPVSKIKPVKYLRKEKKSFNYTEVDALKSNCDNDKTRALVELLLSSGVRVEELSNLDKTDIDFTTFEVHVRNGKGGKARITYMSEVAAVYLKKYLESRTDNSESLFTSQLSDRISPGGVRYELHQLEKKANVTNVHPHRFRRTFATTMHQRGMDIRTIQLLMGHSNINTTTTYIASDCDRVKAEYKRHA